MIVVKNIDKKMGYIKNFKRTSEFNQFEIEVKQILEKYNRMQYASFVVSNIVNLLFSMDLTRKPSAHEISSKIYFDFEHLISKEQFNLFIDKLLLNITADGSNTLTDENYYDKIFDALNSVTGWEINSEMCNFTDKIYNLVQTEIHKIYYETKDDVYKILFYHTKYEKNYKFDQYGNGYLYFVKKNINLKIFNSNYREKIYHNAISIFILNEMENSNNYCSYRKNENRNGNELRTVIKFAIGRKTLLKPERLNEKLDKKIDEEINRQKNNRFNSERPILDKDTFISFIKKHGDKVFLTTYGSYYYNNKNNKSNNLSFNSLFNKIKADIKVNEKTNTIPNLVLNIEDIDKNNLTWTFPDAKNLKEKIDLIYSCKKTGYCLVESNLSINITMFFQVFLREQTIGKLYESYKREYDLKNILTSL